MVYIQSIGYIAAVLQVLMWGPQIFKILKHKSVEGLSYYTYFIINVVSFMWVIYSALVGIEGLAAFISNGLTLIAITPIIIMILKYNRKPWIHVLLINISILVFAIFLLIFSKWNVPTWSKILLSVLAGIASASSFIPQMVKTLKLKEIENFSMILGYMRLISASLWVTHFLLMYIYNKEANFLISSIFVFIGFLSVIPIVYIGVKNSKEKRATQV